MTGVQHGPGEPFINPPPPPPPPPPLALYTPAALVATLSEKQRRRVALVELEFAQAVSELLSVAYRDIRAIAREEEDREVT